MTENNRSKRLKWILSLLLGPIAFIVLLLVSPETPTFDEIMQKLTQFVFCFLILWIVGFGIVWGLYAMAGYVQECKAKNLENR
jgi:hypothetical protein